MTKLMELIARTKSKRRPKLRDLTGETFFLLTAQTQTQSCRVTQGVGFILGKSVTLLLTQPWR